MAGLQNFGYWTYRTLSGDFRTKHPLSPAHKDFSIFGPTCDSLDHLAVPLPLPANIAEGDYILFENTGAYTHSIATRFNGYGDVKTIEISNT